MKRILFVLFAALAIIVTADAEAQTDTTFTYQGELQENGSPANGAFDIEFKLWNAATGGNQIGNEFENDELPVVNGRFAVELDFGANAFDNSARWLEIEVNGGTLSPRMPITRTPYSIQTRGIVVDELSRVGIGTDALLYRLNVEGGIKSNSLILSDYPTPGFSFIFLDQDELKTKNYAAGDISFWTGGPDDNHENLTIKPDGKVGIGTSAPDFLLHVDGSAGKPGGGAWSSASDVRLKKNIQPIEDALGTLLRLRGVTFEYIAPDAIHELPGERIGMIAQEVEKVVPDWNVGDRQPFFWASRGSASERQPVLGGSLLSVVRALQTC